MVATISYQRDEIFQFEYTRLRQQNNDLTHLLKMSLTKFKLYVIRVSTNLVKCINHNIA
jgi:hypothetical protein